MAYGNTSKDGTGTFYHLVVDSNGYLYVVSGGNQVDDAAFTPGTSRITVMGAEADEVTPDSVDEGDAGALRMSLDRQLLVQCSGRVAEDDLVASHYPVLVGGRYDATARSVDDTDVATLACDAAGRLLVTTNQGGRSVIGASASGNIKASAGILHCLTVSLTGGTAGDYVFVKDGGAAGTIRLQVALSGGNETIHLANLDAAFVTSIYAQVALAGGGTCWYTGVYT